MSVTTRRVIDQLAGPQKMRRHASDSMLGSWVTSNGRSGQVWASYGHKSWYVVDSTGAAWVFYEEGMEVVKDRTGDAELFDVA